MPGDKKIAQSEPLAPGLKSDVHAKMDDQNQGSIASGVSSAKGGVANKAAGAHCSPTSCYDYQYPGHNGSYNQIDGSGGSAYSDSASLLYYMPGYNPYYNQIDAQQPYFSSSEPYSWNSASKSSVKSNDFNFKRTMNSYTGKSPNYPFDMKSRHQSASSNIPKSFLQAQHLRSINKSGGFAKGYQPSGNFSSMAYRNQELFSNSSMNYASGGGNGKLWNENDRYKSREKLYSNGESEELTRGPRGQTVNSHVENDKIVERDEKYNLEDFQTKYEDAKFYVIKSYSEDDVHKSIKYDVWSSTPNGNKKLDAAFRDAHGKIKIFLFFSVNGSGQFVGVAEMIGPVDYEKNMDFWQLDKWNGFFPVKWHIVKDVPNTQLRHIILENNDNRPVTYTRDTQEVGLKHGLEILEIFKSYSAKTSLLDDLSFYENRESVLKAKRINKAAFQTEKNSKLKEGANVILSSSTASLINLTQNLSLNSSKASN